MIPYNTRKVIFDMLEQDEIRTLKIDPKPTAKKHPKKSPWDILFPPKKHTLAEMIRYALPRVYRGGGVALFKEFDGETYVLLGQRRFNPFSGRWSFPGGGAEKGETLGKAAFRELHEELGVRLLKTEAKIVGRYELNTPLFKWKTVLVRTEATILGKTKKKENLFKKYRNCSFGEFWEVRWVPLSQLRNYNLHPCVLGAVAQFK